MPLLTRRSHRFLQWYQESLPRFKLAAQEAQAFAASTTSPYGYAIHAVTARAKELDSLRAKLRRKAYRSPQKELTDLIGVRVITYFAADVDFVAGVLKERMEISTKKSRDARRDLEHDKFGYRSLHLIARLRLSDAHQQSNTNLARNWFEIQIRSILDHAWAEIEHETVYKSAIDFPWDVRRRFRAVAGALEVIESAFSGLTGECDLLVERYKEAYKARRQSDRRFDAARLIAFMETEFPGAASLRTLGVRQTVLQPTNCASLVDALQSVKAHNPRLLRTAFARRRFHTLVKVFAAEVGCSPEEVSHRARIILAVAILRPELMHLHFPELLGDPALRRTIAFR